VTRFPEAATVQLLLFHTSPDSDDERCICSLCRQPFRDSEVLERHAEPDDAEWFDAVEHEDQSHPIRLWPEEAKRKDWEIRFHPACLEKITDVDSDPMVLKFRPELHVSWIWGDDERGRLVVKPLVSP
jgi:hypothetical protein